MSYASWLTTSLEPELQRLTQELARSEIRYEALMVEYDRKWSRLRYQIRRIQEIQQRAEDLDVQVRRARGRRRERVLRDYLSEVRASVTPYLKRREDIIVDIGFERDTYKLPLESRMRYLREQIALIEDELDRRRRAPRRRLVDVKIIVFSTVTAKRPGRKYEKRFQAFFDIDAIKDLTSGEFDYSSKLTQSEIDECITQFYAFWNWAMLPSTASPPRWIESGQWRNIDEPKGADVKQLSVRFDEEEIYSYHFRPPRQIYWPSKQEREEIMRRVQ